MLSILTKGLLLIILLLLGPRMPVRGYSVLTHEAIIDATWDNLLLPALRAKYPRSTDSQLREARAYAYGGAVAPDMGYFPLGSKLFTNLIHYVRSGDFIRALLDEARNVNEYAFALGSLAHYHADNYGHPIGTNRTAPMLFPKIRKEYGDTVTYAQDPVSHVRTEFSFDVLQTARGNYASQAYHDFIGFKVADSVLRRAFLKTYGLDIMDIFSNFQRSVNTFRWSVKQLFPALTKTAWASKKSDIKKTSSQVTRRSYIYRIKRRDYFNEFGRDRDKPGITSNSFALLIRILPKIGPLKKLKLIVPGPEAEKIFLQSFDTVVHYYTASVQKLKAVALPNKDFDTGLDTEVGEYELADKSYSDLLLKLKENNFNRVNAALRQNIIAFYETPAVAKGGKPLQHSEEVVAALKLLKARQ